jgi:oligoendopeptidase F
MTPELEMLAADLGVDGKSAWGRLYQQLSGRLEFKMTWPDGTEKMVPMAQRTELVCDADERVRKAAFDGSNKAWEEQEDICAAALNHIAGTRLTLNKRRGVEHFLDVAAFGAAVERSTINAMWEAVASRRDALRDVLKYKAKLLGKEKLGFYDLAAPLPVKDSKKLTWDEAKQLVGDSFANMYDPLGEFAQHAFDQQWVEAEKRPGKRPGAFCTGSIMSKESRVFMTYGGTLNDVHTLAHELGHAYHGWVMRDLRPYSHYYPMTLAETASTFAESVLSHNMLNDPATTDTQKAVILEQRLSDVTVYMLNIHMRYMFEEQFYTERQDGTVTISRLKEMVKEAQLECYGDTLNHDELDLMFWASKLHFYITGVSFYNFPYTFGYLFSQALFQRALAEGKEFMPVYEDVLRETGSATCEDVARKFLDVDLGQPEFWANTIEGVLKDLPTFKELTADFVAAS